jgi:hypothetical protein
MVDRRSTINPADFIWKYESHAFTLPHKVLYMDSQLPPQETLQDIKRIMERSSRFISLSGWSGISAGICALGGAWAAYARIQTYQAVNYGFNVAAADDLLVDLLVIAAITFVAALVTAFLFTWLRSRKDNVPMWGRTAQRLFINTVIPIAVGGVVILRAMEWGYYELVAPGCLIFYGLAVVNGSKYTLGEVRYLGYGQIILGIINLYWIGAGLYFWAAGFGVLHILYGAIMWWKYERGDR